MKLFYRLKQLMLVGGDLIGFTLGFYISVSLRYLHLPDWKIIESHLVLFFLLFSIWIIINFISGLYDLGKPKKIQSWRYLVECSLISLVVSIIFIYLFPTKGISPKTILILTIIFGYGLSGLWRLIYNQYVGLHSLKSNVIFVGLTDESKELVDIIQNNPQGIYKVVALIEPFLEIKTKDFPFFDIYNSLNSIPEILEKHQADILVIAPHIQKEASLQNELYKLLFSSIHTTDLMSFYENITGRIPPSTFSEAWFLDNLKNNRRPVYEKFKTIIDILAATVIGIFTILIFPIIFITIKLNSKGPIFYKQQRIGQGGKIFYLYKFRSMYALTKDGSAELNGFQFATKDDKRVTKVGRFLRKTRLDELPQFINLFKRDITLIGPRPERPEIVNQLAGQMGYYSLRHIVKPGLTSWAVIHQNYTDDLEKTLQKLQYDLYYIKNRSFFLDLSILLKTINVIVRMMGQ